MVVVSLWMYVADWFAVFMDLLVLVGLGRVCFGVKRGEEEGGLLVSGEASWSPRPGLTFAADPQIRANWVNPSLRQPTQEKLATIIFRQKLPLSCFGFTMLLPGVNTFY